MLTTPKIVGQSVPRTDGPDKVTGAACYAADLGLPDTLYGKLLRSPYPYARIVEIDVSEAARLPGVYGVLSGADLHGAMSGRRIFDMPVLASSVVRFVGEPVAAVAAVDDATARSALDRIKVVYEELPAVFEPAEASAADAPILHPGFNEYFGVKPRDVPSNVYATMTWGQGDIEDGFGAADVVVEGTYSASAVHQMYLESHTCLVRCTEAGGMEVWASNKAPHSVKRQIAYATGVSEEQIIVHHVAIGGDFGGKGSAMNIPICYFLAKLAGRPVQMAMDYAEELAAGNPRHAALIHVKTGVNLDGTILACDVQCTFNTGAYAAFLPLGFLPGPRHCVGPYKIPHARVTAHHVYTNQVPSGHMRGPGEPQAIFAMESHMDVVARKLGLSPAELRLRNVIREGDSNSLGERYRNLHGAETIEAALDATAYRMAKPEPVAGLRYGRGIAVGERAPGGGETHTRVMFRSDGSVVLYTSIFEQGSGTYTTMRQMVADVLGLPISKIELAVWDTDETGFDSGAGASRNTRMASEAAYEAATDARHELVGTVADLKHWPVATIRCEKGLLVDGESGQSMRIADLLEATGRVLSGRSDHKDTGHADITAFTVQVAEVTVDVETGEVRLLRFTSVHDAGSVLNPQGHDGQIYGGAMQGIGYGLMEGMAIESGYVSALSLADYKIPNIADVPAMQAIAIESDGGVGPFNIKGIGENPVSPAAAAIANAIEDAVGVRAGDLPITAERLLLLLRADS